MLNLTGTEGQNKYPVHLHLGNLSTPGADVALLLNPLSAETGLSETTFDKLADESAINYAGVLQLDACIKVHLGDVGPDRDVILAAGNIGTASTSMGGRAGVAVCKSE